MTKKTRRRFTPEYKEQAVARLSEPGVNCASLSAELGITTGQLKTWHLELLAAGSAMAIAQTKTEAAALAQLRRDVKRLKEENEVMRKASIFFSLSGDSSIDPIVTQQTERRIGSDLGAKAGSVLCGVQQLFPHFPEAAQLGGGSAFTFFASLSGSGPVATGPDARRADVEHRYIHKAPRRRRCRGQTGRGPRRALCIAEHPGSMGHPRRYPVAGPRQHANGQCRHNLLPSIPKMELGQIVRPHQPYEVYAWMRPLQRGYGFGCVPSAHTCLSIADDDTRVAYQLASRRHPRRQGGRAARLQRVSGAYQPDHPVKPKPAQRLSGNVQMPRMGRIKGTAKQPNALPCPQVETGTQSE